MVVNTEAGRPRVNMKGMDQYSPMHCQAQGVDEYPSWNTMPPMMAGTPAATTTTNALKVPYPHFALVGIDWSGQLKFHSSLLEKFNGPVFTSEFKQWFERATGVKALDRSPIFAGDDSYQGRSWSMGQEVDVFPNPAYPKKRRREMIHHQAPIEPEEPQVNEMEAVEMVPLEIGNEEKIEAYYESAFRAFQQINCRQVAKAYIKIIEPRKQVKHPYNGGRGAPGEKGDPEKTKPDWWPTGVIHREPDHLKKPERIRLLVHIFRKLGKTHGITADKLEEAGRDAQRQIKPRERLDILDEIYKVRRAEECYERGEADANAVVYVVNRDANTKAERESEAMSDAGQNSVLAEESRKAMETKYSALSPSHAPKRHSIVRDHKPPHLYRTPNLADFSGMESKPPTDQTIEYFSQPEFATSPVDEHISSTMRDSHHWSSFQQPLYSPVEYTTNHLVPQQLLAPPSMVTSEPPNSALQPTHGLPIPEPHGSRHQSFDYISMDSNPFNAGPMTHPLLPQNSQESDPVARYK
ncbi:hypothetical protein MGYG_03511 [Nannizzia gypsea CBS 118893]|uniref:Subtelomeric hrmA-associated cluster protein AFUB-079030/YDR124W-like helical bundle domain-containing protein n=1 Tax=Arthroderma gypseum (strain ATCC MYA-4604 / CBS 118893) TaxID=535722 RepID=E4USE1_ARTGP|nr:hypothetical protein MGYG_03511 [Nannizzia gypsea CBS 118893]EFR00508.1 hypothetical protein MGYG_03511 [Nannizzia gypsea CBS 118893]